MHVVELRLDDAADAAVRALWVALAARGIEPLGGAPHVSLAAFAGGDVATARAAVAEATRDVAGLALPLGAVGFFPTAEAVAFLAVMPSARLLALQEAVHAALVPHVTGLGAYYAPGAWLPHCTLALGVTDPAAALAAVGPVEIAATASGAELVDYRR